MPLSGWVATYSRENFGFVELPDQCGVVATKNCLPHSRGRRMRVDRNKTARITVRSVGKAKRRTREAGSGDEPTESSGRIADLLRPEISGRRSDRQGLPIRSPISGGVREGYELQRRPVREDGEPVLGFRNP